LTDAIALAGLAVLALTIVGVNSSPSDDPPRNAQAQAVEADLMTMAGPVDDELADLRDERDDARLRAARGADRPATDVAPSPITAPPARWRRRSCTPLSSRAAERRGAL